MNIKKIFRTAQSEYARKMREIAQGVESGDVVCATVIVFDKNGKSEEFILPYDEVFSAQQA